MKKYSPVVVSSIHGFKSHGKWQTKLADILTTKKIPGKSFDYGYQFLSCLNPGFRKMLVKNFYHDYCLLLQNRDYKIDTRNPLRRPSVIAHSLGSFILCKAMMKYPDIRFDKIILCGSIVHEDFNWDLLFKRNQVHFVRNEFSSSDKIVRWGWLLSLNRKCRSGRKGFLRSASFFNQEEFEYFDHSSFFEGGHINKYWIPFLLKEPPNFHIINGEDIESLDQFTKFFNQTLRIDDDSFGNEVNWKEFAIPDGLAEQWIEINRSIYSFLATDSKHQRIIGYINAMPLEKKIFEKLLEGKIHDNEIEPTNILTYEECNSEIDLYIMSIALNPNFQTMHLGLRDLGFEKLFNSIIDKLSKLFIEKGIKVRRLAAVGWTKKGERLCQLLGMRETGAVEEQTNKPIYLLELNEAGSSGNLHKSIFSLLKQYKKSIT
ncbi:MAG TPA: hypothetical protein VK787_01160 [Puia sp.]|jgi:hypothetical protein|nr:hypothetical protein [Puia sp.]